MLELSGVTDAEWLRAVAEHHETPDGQGYPHGLRAVCDTAALIRRADITAKLRPARAAPRWPPTRPAVRCSCRTRAIR